VKDTQRQLAVYWQQIDPQHTIPRDNNAILPDNHA